MRQNPVIKKLGANVFFLMGIVLFCWGTFAALSKISLGKMDEYQTQFYMFLWAEIGMTFMLLLNGGFKKLAELKLGNIVKLILITIPSFLYYLFYLFAIKEIPVVEASILNYTFPIFIVIFAVPINRERLNILSIISVLIGFAGVVVILASGSQVAFEISNFKGHLYALMGAMCWGIFSNLGKKIEVDPILSNYVYTSVCLVLSTLLVQLKSEFILPDIIAMGGSACIGLTNIVIGYYMWFRVLKQASTTLVASMSFLTPFVTLFFIFLLLKESIQLKQVTGLAIILLGIAVQYIGPLTRGAAKNI